MESVGMGAFMDGEWESLCRMLSFDESNFGDHFVTFPADDDNNFHNPLNYLFSHGNNSNLSDSTSYNNFPSKTSYDTSHLNLSPCNEFEFPGGNDSFMNTCYLQENEGELLVSPFPLDSLIIEPELAGDSDQSACQGSPMSTPEIQLKRRYIAPEVEATPVKKGRISKHKGKNTVQSDLQSEETEDNMTNAGSSTHCPTHENSDNEESNASQRTSDGENSASKELMGSITNSKGSKRASRGKATDPQSLYARRRRQRINERLRILQNLVPNGTKVDISTMLEEAVHYVKFLKLQLKLLSSDDLWMYAPIAYNGVDINLCRKISPFQIH